MCASGDCVTSTHDVEQGDSGGLLFYVDRDDRAYVAGTIATEFNDHDSDNCGDDTKSTTAQTIENKRGGSFMTI
jgi:hypothetical protein